MERALTSSQEKISPMPTDPKGEKRPADVLGKPPFQALSLRVVQRSKAGASKDPASGPNFRG
jgi:hypothetical protein